MTIGVLLANYTIVAMMLGYPQISDLLPLGLFVDGDGEFYKIVPSDEASSIDYYVIGLGVLIVAIRLIIHKTRM